MDSTKQLPPMAPQGAGPTLQGGNTWETPPVVSDPIGIMQSMQQVPQGSTDWLRLMAMLQGQEGY